MPRRGARRPGKYLSPAVLDRVADKVYRAAEEAGARIALLGGFAMQYYDAPHLTNDLDFVADETAFYAGEFDSRLGIGGERWKVDGVEVDIIRRKDKYKGLYEEALNHPEVVEGVPYPIVAPEYLVAMKMAARREKDEEHLRFLLSDVELDWEKTVDVVLRHLGPHAVDLLEAYKDTAEWQAMKKRRETE